MVTNPLVNLPSEAREAGWKLLEALERSHFPFAALFWAEFDEYEWRIFLATPLVDEPGAQNPYETLYDVFYSLSEEERGGLSLSDIVLVRPTANIVAAVQKRYAPVTGDRRTVQRISLSPNEAYVYQLRPSEHTAPIGAAA